MEQQLFKLKDDLEQLHKFSDIVKYMDSNNVCRYISTIVIPSDKYKQITIRLRVDKKFIYAHVNTSIHEFDIARKWFYNNILRRRIDSIGLHTIRKCMCITVKSGSGTPLMHIIIAVNVGTSILVVPSLVVSMLVCLNLFSNKNN